jgi:hypothetical protein
MFLKFGLVLIVIGGLAALLFMMLRSHRRIRVSGIGPQRDDRELAIKEPYFKREVVEAKVKSLFPNSASAEIPQSLDDVPHFNWSLERIQLAILKLSNGDLNQLHYYLALAKNDFHKVIRLAEYPEASRIGLLNVVKLPDAEQERIFNQDLRQYIDWLKKR